jgi:hypothetical protein
MSRVIQKYVNVNTKFRPYVKGEQSKSTDFLVTLPNPIRNVLSMKLKTFNAPDSEYTFSINLTNNCFEVIDATAPPPANTQLITIPPGNYIGLNLITVVNNALTAAGGAAANLELTYVSSGALGGLDRYAFKLIAVAAPPNVTLDTLELNFDVKPNNYIYNTFGWKLGFQKSYYSAQVIYNTIITPSPPAPAPGGATIAENVQVCPKNIGNVGGISSITSGPTPPGPAALSYYMADTPIPQTGNKSPYYLLSINDFLNQSDLTFHEACFPSNNIMDNIFARINSKYAQDNNTVYETDNTECYKRTFSGPVTLSKFHIKLYDDNNNILDLNNADYSFLLELEVKT